MTAQSNPFSLMFASRKFWIAMLDATISIVLLLATRYLSPTDLDLVKQVILILQPVILILIGSIAYEDKARMENADSVVTQTQLTPAPVVQVQTVTESKPTTPEAGIPTVTVSH